MRLSSFAIMAPLVSVLLTTTTLAVDTAETSTDNNNNKSSIFDQQETVETKQVSSLPIRRFPALWNFEVDDDFTETPELLAQMQEAFLLSANEVHNSADIKFLSTFIRGSIHEHLAEEEVSNKKKKKTTMMMMLDGEEDEDFEQEDYYYEVEQEDEPMDAAHDYYTRGGKTRMLGKIVNRPSNKKFGPIFRPNYQTLNNVGCNLCSDDDDATSSMLASPLELGSAFYQLEDGRDIRLAWQRKFCQKLRSIPELEKARRCFIYFDLDHEEPVDNMDESSMVTLADI